MTTYGVTELCGDLLRRAEACEELADACARDASDGHPCSTEIAIARRRGKADAYRHAAELLRSSPVAAEVERLRAECADLDAAATAARDEAADARRARDAAEDALRGVWHEVAPDAEGFPRVLDGDDEVADGATIAARVGALRAERDAALAEVALWRGDETAALLGAAAAGVLPRCDSCEGGALATLYARTPAGELWSCDAHRGGDQWEDLPHAARLRAAGEKELEARR